MAKGHGTTGPHPLPTALHKLRGSDRKRKGRDPDKEPVPEDGPVIAPAWLDRVAKGVWKFYAPKLKKMKVLTPADRETLAMYCQAVSDYRRALEMVRNEGSIVTLDTGYKQQHPAVGIMNKARDAAMKWGMQLGLTPSARCKLQVDGKDDAVDEFDAFLKFTG